MTDLRTAAQQALEALKSCSGVPHWPALQPTIAALRAALAQQDEGGGNPPPPLPVPPEVAATLTTADIAWLATYRLTRLWTELGQMRWVGVDKGWDLAIEAVRRRLDAECQDVLAWKARADQSGATAVELLQKMQRL